MCVAFSYTVRDASSPTSLRCYFYAWEVSLKTRKHKHEHTQAPRARTLTLQIRECYCACVHCCVCTCVCMCGGMPINSASENVQSVTQFCVIQYFYYSHNPLLVCPSIQLRTRTLHRPLHRHYISLLYSKLLLVK